MDGKTFWLHRSDLPKVGYSLHADRPAFHDYRGHPFPDSSALEHFSVESWREMAGWSLSPGETVPIRFHVSRTDPARPDSPERPAPSNAEAYLRRAVTRFLELWPRKWCEENDHLPLHPDPLIILKLVKDILFLHDENDETRRDAPP